NEYDPEYGLGLGDYFAGFVEEEARAHGLTLAELDAWTPTKGARRKKTTRKKKAASAEAPKKRGRKKAEPLTAEASELAACERCGSPSAEKVEADGRWFCADCKPQVSAL